MMEKSTNFDIQQISVEYLFDIYSNLRHQQLCERRLLAPPSRAASLGLESSRTIPDGMPKAAKKTMKTPARRDGRRAMLTYMKPELIEAVKDAAAASDQKAWQWIEKAVERALKSKRP